MIDYKLFFFFLAMLIVGSLLTGWYANRGKASLHAVEDFFLASKNIGFFALVLTLLATQVGGGMFSGISKVAVHAGPFALSYSLGQALGFLVLGLGVGARMRMLHVKTIAEILSTYYHSMILRRIAGLISVISLTGILIAMVIAFRNFLGVLGITQVWVLVIIWIILVGYTVLGGLRVVIATDMFQILFIGIVLVGVMSSIIYYNPTLAKDTLCNFDYQAAYNYSKSNMLDWVLLPFLFMFIEQDMAQRLFATKTKQMVNKACCFAGTFLIIFALVPTFLGMLAYGIPSEKLHGDIFIAMVAQYTNPLISAIAACAVLAAIMSTADSLLMAISSNICQDFLPHVKIKVAKIITATVGMFALLLAYLLDDILSILIKSYEMSVYCLFVLVFCVLWRKENNAYLHNYTAWGSMLGGCAGFVTLQLMQSSIPAPLFALAISFVGFWIGHLVKNSRSN